LCQKVRVCCLLRLRGRPHCDLASESRCVKYAIQNFRTFSINRSYVLQLCQASTVPYSNKPAKRVLHAHSSINIDPSVRAELSREAPSDLAVDKFLKTFSGNLRSLLNSRSEMHLTPHQTQLMTQQTTRIVSLDQLGVMVHVWPAATLPNCSLRTENCATFTIIPRTMHAALKKEEEEGKGVFS
jgi:hypothetical protein